MVGVKAKTPDFILLFKITFINDNGFFMTFQPKKKKIPKKQRNNDFKSN